MHQAADHLEAHLDLDRILQIARARQSTSASAETTAARTTIMSPSCRPSRPWGRRRAHRSARRGGTHVVAAAARTRRPPSAPRPGPERRGNDAEREDPEGSPTAPRPRRFRSTERPSPGDARRVTSAGLRTCGRAAVAAGPTRRRFPAFGPVRMTAFVPAHRCGAVPASTGFPLATLTRSVKVPTRCDERYGDHDETVKRKSGCPFQSPPVRRGSSG